MQLNSTGTRLSIQGIRAGTQTCVTGIQLVAAPHKAQSLLLDQLVQEDQVEVTCGRGEQINRPAAPFTVNDYTERSDGIALNPQRNKHAGRGDADHRDGFGYVFRGKP